MPLDTFLSSKFRFWSFVSMVLLVFVHGYNLHERYLQLLPCVVAGICVITGYLIRAVSTKVYGFLTGGRGLV